MRLRGERIVRRERDGVAVGRRRARSSMRPSVPAAPPLLMTTTVWPEGLAPSRSAARAPWCRCRCCRRAGTARSCSTGRAGVGLRPSDAGEGRKRGSARRQMQKLTPWKFRHDAAFLYSVDTVAISTAQGDAADWPAPTAVCSASSRPLSKAPSERFAGRNHCRP